MTFLGIKSETFVLQVGGRQDSDVYIKMKMKAATDIGIKAEVLKLAKSDFYHFLSYKIIC